MIIFRVGADDADFLEKEFEPEFTTQDLVNLPNYNIYLKLMIDGVSSRPFSATTLPPLKVDLSLGVRDRIIAKSRELYTRPREEVEEEITKWSGTLQTSDGEEKYKADCTNCQKSTMVPFEPKEGRPIYCKECMYKIKSGELQAGTGFLSSSRSSNRGEESMAGPLASLGIEFDTEKGKESIVTVNDSHNDKTTRATERKNDKFKPNNQNNNYKKNNKIKRGGPSPLLKGLLQKIGVNNKEKLEEKKIEVEDIKAPSPSPMSLNSLKKDNNHI